MTLPHHIPDTQRHWHRAASWGELRKKALPFIMACCGGGVPRQCSMSSQIFKGTPLAGFTSTHWIPFKPKDSEMTPWELRKSPLLPQNPPWPALSLQALMRGQAPSPQALLSPRALTPSTDAWLAALRGSPDTHLNPDRGSSWVGPLLHPFLLFATRMRESISKHHFQPQKLLAADASRGAWSSWGGGRREVGLCTHASLVVGTCTPIAYSRSVIF